MRVYDLPLATKVLINLRAVPVHRAFAALAYVLQCQDRGVADDLDTGIDDLLAIDLDFSADLIVPSGQGRETVEATIEERIEVRHVLRVNFEETVRIAFAPAIECRTLQCHDFSC